MNTVAGIFQTHEDAARAIEDLRRLGLSDENLSLLSPGTTAPEAEADVETSDTEQPGMGNALGGLVGGAMGAAGGMTLGAAAASLLVPGVGPIMAAGIVGAALFGAGGAAAGMAAGGALEDTIAHGLPHDELFVYEDALRQGRTVVIAQLPDDGQVYDVRAALDAAGAESVDAARESWWIGLRDAEDEDYTGQGRDFKSDEPIYRRGFEAALHPQMRGASYAESAERLRERYSDAYEHDAFRRGYERGRNYHETLRERYKS
ncbi:MAG TPA: hypothetical protein VK388_11180 [Pyrinomonadaceae bacterium]|nr:hypothetical protein [Pyrinomonadaceae bacterium]